MKESLLLFVILTVVVAIFAGVFLFSQKPASVPQVTADDDAQNDDVNNIINQQSLQKPTGSVVDYTKEETSGPSSVGGWFKNAFSFL